MKKVTIFIDGYNLYHAIDNLKKPHLKWINLLGLSQEFAKPINGFEIINAKFFTAPPLHKSKEVQERYFTYIAALKHYGVEIIEGKFKRKLVKYRDDKGNSFTRTTHEEKESDVNIALAILEDAFERISDKILVITNDSDISPAIRIALKKNDVLRINVITPPLTKTKRANYDLLDACGSVNKNKKGQVYFKTRMISQEHLEKNLLPSEIVVNEDRKITIPDKYRV